MFRDSLNMEYILTETFSLLQVTQIVKTPRLERTVLQEVQEDKSNLNSNSLKVPLEYSAGLVF